MPGTGGKHKCGGCMSLDVVWVGLVKEVSVSMRGNGMNSQPHLLQLVGAGVRGRRHGVPGRRPRARRREDVPRPPRLAEVHRHHLSSARSIRLSHMSQQHEINMLSLIATGQPTFRVAHVH